VVALSLAKSDMVDAISVLLILYRAHSGSRFGVSDEKEAAASGDGAGGEGDFS